jgi:broad specificity phosphatase PhoE
MTSTTVHLVRHGEVENPDHVVYASLPGFGLSSRGQRQAAAAGERLRRGRVTLVLSSPLQRALETAAIVASSLQAAVSTDARLLEWQLGEHWAGTRWNDLDLRFPGQLDAYLDHPEDLEFSPESLDRLARRVSALVEEVASANAGTETVVVSHQDPIQAGRLNLTGRPLAGLQSNKPGHCSVVTLSREPGGPAWTESSYWEPDQGTAFPPIRPGEH